MNLKVLHHLSPNIATCNLSQSVLSPRQKILTSPSLLVCLVSKNVIFPGQDFTESEAGLPERDERVHVFTVSLQYGMVKKLLDLGHGWRFGQVPNVKPPHSLSWCSTFVAPTICVCAWMCAFSHFCHINLYFHYALQHGERRSPRAQGLCSWTIVWECVNVCLHGAPTGLSLGVGFNSKRTCEDWQSKKCVSVWVEGVHGCSA